jgi:hypothetical protein
MLHEKEEQKNLTVNKLSAANHSALHWSFFSPSLVVLLRMPELHRTVYHMRWHSPPALNNQGGREKMV